MNESMNERLVMLAKAQQSVLEVIDNLEKWDSSQKTLESSTYGTLNAMDSLVNLITDGNDRMLGLVRHCVQAFENLPEEDMGVLVKLVEDMERHYEAILETALRSNDDVHKLEEEVIHQSAIGDCIKNTVHEMEQSVSETVACVEFKLAEI
jgi:hypothetical protein